MTDHQHTWPPTSPSLGIAPRSGTGSSPAEFAPRKRPTTVPAADLSDRYSGGIWGTRLRHAALAVLICARGQPVTLMRMWDEIISRHIVQAGLTRKDLADAVRHECRRGRARRVARGAYAVGVIAPRTRRRIMAHDKELLISDPDAVAQAWFHNRKQS